MDKDTGIILEGGAMRSIFTAGVMDFFLDKNIDIPNILAVSAGAYAGMNYASGQKGRILSSVVEPMAHEKMLGPGVFIKTGEFFNMDALFDRIPRFDCPFDFETFKASGKRFVTSTINCMTGDLCYFDRFNNLDEFLHIVRVANSLPLLARMGYIDDIPMMDGGMADAIPIRQAIAEGWKKIIVVFTREASYRKSEHGDIYNSHMVKRMYRKFPGLLKAIDERPHTYNSSIEMLNEMEKRGEAFVIRPTKVKLTNNESDSDKLKEYYKAGYEDAAARYDELMEYLNK